MLHPVTVCVFCIMLTKKKMMTKFTGQWTTAYGDVVQVDKEYVTFVSSNKMRKLEHNIVTHKKELMSKFELDEFRSTEQHMFWMDLTNGEAHVWKRVVKKKTKL